MQSPYAARSLAHHELAARPANPARRAPFLLDYRTIHERASEPNPSESTRIHLHRLRLYLHSTCAFALHQRHGEQHQREARELCGSLRRPHVTLKAREHAAAYDVTSREKRGSTPLQSFAGGWSRGRARRRRGAQSRSMPLPAARVATDSSPVHAHQHSRVHPGVHAPGGGTQQGSTRGPEKMLRSHLGGGQRSLRAPGHHSTHRMTLLLRNACTVWTCYKRGCFACTQPAACMDFAIHQRVCVGSCAGLCGGQPARAWWAYACGCKFSRRRRSLSAASAAIHATSCARFASSSWSEPACTSVTIALRRPSQS